MSRVAQTVGDLVRTPRAAGDLVRSAPSESVAEAVERMQSVGISQLPVLKDGRALGSIQEVTIARLLHDGLDPEAVFVGDVMARPLPQLDVGFIWTRPIDCFSQETRAYWRSRRGRCRDHHADRPDLVLEPSPRGLISFPSASQRMATPNPAEHAEQGFSTRAIHAGQEADPATGATVVPIYATSTFTQEAPGRHKGYEYSRSGNPTRTALETCLAALENGERAPGLRVGSGGHDCRISTLRPGDEVVAAADLYGGTFRLLERVFKPWGLVPRYTEDPSPRRLCQRRYAGHENGLDRDADQSALAGHRHRRHRGVAHRRGASWSWTIRSLPLFLQKPLELGADLVVHSTTKYLGGHSDMIGGAVIGGRELLEPIAFYQNAAGGVPGPFDSWLVLRGIKTLAVRMERHCRERAPACRMAGRAPAGRAGVLSRACRTTPTTKWRARQMRDFGGMISIRLKRRRRREKHALSEPDSSAWLKALEAWNR